MKRKLPFVIIILALVVGVTGYIISSNNNADTAPPPSHHSTKKKSAVPDFDHIVTIVMENRGLDEIIGSDQAPYLNQLASNNSLAANYHALFHPSLPNYIALTSGSSHGITTDCSPPGGNCLANAKNIADEVETSGRSWKTYQESMPVSCTAKNAGNYATRHDPFIYYADILHNQKRCKNSVVPLSQLTSDLADKKLPNYVFVTPNLCNDMHNCSVGTGDNWLKRQVPKLLNSYAFKRQNSLLIITFDEAEGSNAENKVPAIFVGRGVKEHFVSHKNYSHYSLLKTIETTWNLPPLATNDKNASPMTDIFTQQK